MRGGNRMQGGKKTPGRILFDSLPLVNQRVVSSRTGSISTYCELTEAFLALVDFKTEKLHLFKKVK